MQEAVGGGGGIGRSGLGLATLLAAALLSATLAWTVPMMLWDHLDLVPMYEAWQSGALPASQVASVHDGSHMHLTAYLLLLVTTWLSDGRPWLDCLLSGVLLCLYAVVALRVAGRMLPVAAHRGAVAGVIGFALYPGHLANLQWGWQVAVFLCLAGVAVVLAALTRETLRWRDNGIALVAAAVATTSFSTGLAVVPVAVLLIASRTVGSWQRRVALAAPWLAMGLGMTALLAASGPGDHGVRPAAAALYVLNYLGGGIARFATGLAPWLAAAALASAAFCAFAVRRDPRTRFWAALLCFAIGAAFLTAIGRVSAFGTDQAFVSRYVSFSSVFWMGWCGLAALTRPRLGRGQRRALDVALVAVLLSGTFNGLHLAKKAREVAQRAEQTAEAIRSQYPEVDEAILREIYFGRSAEAMQRLDTLHRHRFAPFGAGDP